MWNPDTQLQEHAQQYAAAHDGRHPYTDAWPWAEAIVAWQEQYSDRSRRMPHLEPEERVLVVAGVAESLRLAMARGQAVGDIALYQLKDELLTWLWLGEEFPVPGEAGWPAPSGPHANQWRALMNLVHAAPERGRIITRAGRVILGDLCNYGGHRPHLPGAAYRELTERRFRARNYDVVSLAEVAPALGLPALVADPGWYEGVIGLVAEHAA
ncbi:hypothetical protein ACIRPT_38450 [Streptomyces sp. NPDC101227]|uniref:hypothetical protein n=1 Tax=Streptomyces sp. NPDC101227 TaxID=3366136 RepID=UPI0038066203